MTICTRASSRWWDDLPASARAARIGLALLVGLALTWLVDSWLAAGSTLFFANTLLTSDTITKESLRLLANNLVFCKSINRKYDSYFSGEGASSRNGDSVRVRKPPRYLGRTGSAMVTEAIEETSVTVTLDTEFGVDLEVSNKDLTLSLDNFSDKCLAPAVSRIATYIDQKCMEKAAKVIPYSVGTPGTIPTALLTYGLAGSKLDDNAAPQDEHRYMTISSRMQTYIVDAAKGLFQASQEIARQYRKGRMGMFGGFTWQMSQNVYTHTVGAFAGTPLVNGAGQSGTSLVTDGWTATTSVINEGDILTLAGSNHVNPSNYMSTGELQQQRVTGPVTADASGNKTIGISPGLTTSGARQTVDAAPANNAVISVVGAASTQTPQGIAHHRDVITLAMADLPRPKGKDMVGLISDEQTGLAMRFVRDFETRSGQWLTRIDVIFGVADLRGESLGCRLAS